MVQVKIIQTLINVLKAILPIIALMIILGLIVYFVYTMAGSAIQRMEHRKHIQEEEALKSIEIMEEATKDIGGETATQVFNFELMEGGKYRIYNTMFEYSFYDPDTENIIVTIYCNEQPYDTVEFQPLGEEDAIALPTFKCPDWGTERVFTVTLTPKKYIKGYFEPEESARHIIIEHYLLEFQVKTQVIED